MEFTAALVPRKGVDRSFERPVPRRYFFPSPSTVMIELEDKVESRKLKLEIRN